MIINVIREGRATVPVNELRTYYENAHYESLFVHIQHQIGDSSRTMRLTLITIQR